MTGWGPHGGCAPLRSLQGFEAVLAIRRYGALRGKKKREGPRSSEQRTPIACDGAVSITDTEPSQ